MQRWLNQVLHEFKKPVIYNLYRDFLRYSQLPEQINSVATFEKGKRGNAY